MRLNKIKKIASNSYIRNIKIRNNIGNLISRMLILFMMLMFLTSCTKVHPSETLTAKEAASIENAKKRSLEIVLFYKDLYEKAEKITPDNEANQILISQESIDEIETLLSKQGFSVINSDSKYPPYLENSNKMYEFWKLVREKKESAQEILSISEAGGLFYSYLQYSEGEKYKTSITINWDENNNPIVLSSEYIEIMDWDLVNDTDFYYQIYPSDRIYDDYLLIRLKPIDKNLYDLTEKYLSPIGYQSNNMFLFDWTFKNYGNLSFNDLFDFLYKIRNHDYFNPQDLEAVQEPYSHAYIPAQLFEETTLHYFDISIQEFRKRSLYDSKKDAYPWQEVCCENVIYYPFVEPEIVAYKENGNGTFTLTANVRCNDYKADCLFTHEVMIRPLEDGNFQYLGNKITYRSDLELPPNYPRLPPQRPNHVEK